MFMIYSFYYSDLNSIYSRLGHFKYKASESISNIVIWVGEKNYEKCVHVGLIKDGGIREGICISVWRYGCTIVKEEIKYK